MKTKFRIPVVLFLAAVVATMLVVSCSSDDDKTPPTDFTALKATIASATNVAANAQEGKSDGQYPTGTKTTLQASITLAQAVVDNPATTQEQADAANVSLQTAVTTFQGLVIVPIAADALIAHWTFDEGTGTTAHDASTHHFDGAFKTGPAGWGAGSATWTTDRAGTANKALHFDKGGNVEVPYNTALNPASMSIAVWVKADLIDANNRFLGLQSWIGYKLQLQEANRPFLSVGVDGATYDRDSEQNLPINEWHHVAVTFGGGKMLFYVDGTLIKTWEDTPKPAKSISAKPYNLVIGQDFPTDKYSAGDGTNFDNASSPDYQVIPLAWGGYYHGSLDELRIYNTVLTGTQVGQLYAQEKP